MAKTKNSDDSGSEDIPAQIKLTINLLIQLSLLEIHKKYNLPSIGVRLPAPRQTLDEPIVTDLYTLEVKSDHHQAHFKLTLNTGKREALVREHKLRNPKWAFLGYLKEEPLTIDEVEINADRWKWAEISTQTNTTLSCSLKKGVPYYALFVIAMEDKDKILLDADRAAMIQLQVTPSIEDISLLKKQLDSLIDVNQKDPVQISMPEVSKNGHLEIAKEATDLKKQLESIGLSQEEIREAVQDYTEHAKHYLHKMISKE